MASSHVTVEGTSTIHDWTVEGRIIRGEMIVQDIALSRFLASSESAAPALTLTPTVYVEIPVRTLKSNTSGLNNKMYEALKADTSPMITYRLEAVEIGKIQTTWENDSGGSMTVNTTGVLTVAGTGRTVDMPMRIKRLPDDRLEIGGETSLRMTEFGIDPPTAMLGMLRTGDKVRVYWTWVLVRGRINNRDDR